MRITSAGGSSAGVRGERQSTQSTQRPRSTPTLRRSVIQHSEERFHVVPHPRQAGDQLMVVVEKRQRHVRPGACELLYCLIRHRPIVQSLEDERRLREGGTERIVLERVLVEREVER